MPACSDCARISSLTPAANFARFNAACPAELAPPMTYAFSPATARASESIRPKAVALWTAGSAPKVCACRARRWPEAGPARLGAARRALVPADRPHRRQAEQRRGPDRAEQLLVPRASQVLRPTRQPSVSGSPARSGVRAPSGSRCARSGSTMSSTGDCGAVPVIARPIIGPEMATAQECDEPAVERHRGGYTLSGVMRPGEVSPAVSRDLRQMRHHCAQVLKVSGSRR